MKQAYITFIALIFSITLFAQGIAVQGIARDNANGAIVNQSLNFSFEILNADDIVKYTETDNIRTDRFGVFSYILGAGNRLQNVDFTEDNLKIKVSVTYNGNVIIVYNEAFNYTPYSHYAKKANEAANGVPTGSILPFMGTQAPEGWLMCDGTEIPVEYTALRAMFSNNRTPNLRGRFLKGAGTGGQHNALVTSQFDETTLGQYQQQSLQDHRHSDGDLKTNTDGSHGHRQVITDFDGNRGQAIPSRVFSGTAFNNDSTNFSVLSTEETGNNSQPIVRNTGSEHSHSITGNTGNAIQKSGAASTQPLLLSTEETKPNNFSVNYIIKL